MKARDLAALAALGIAGKMAYDKFGRKKDDEPKSKGKLGEAQSANDGDAGESEARMSKRDMNEGSGRRDAGGNTEDVDRRAGVAERMGRDAAGSRFTDRDVAAKAPTAKATPVAKAAVAKAAAAKAADTKDARIVTPEEGAKAYVPRRIPGAADGVGATFSSSAEGMENYVPRRTPGAADGVGSTFSSSAEGMENYVPRRTVPDYSNEGRNARTPVNATFSSTEEGMQKYVPRRPGQTTPQATSSSTAEGMAAYVPRRDPNAVSRVNAGRPGFDEVGRPLPVATKVKPQATFSSSEDGMGVGRYMPRNLDVTDKAIMDRKIAELDKRRAKGGVVKMASGGMASSKMSKPSGASRGDGIAQRGRTRGTLR